MTENRPQGSFGEYWRQHRPNYNHGEKMMQIITMHMRSTANAGDLNCAPSQYYPLGQTYCLSKPPPITSDTVLIAGGGGLLHPDFQFWLEPLVRQAKPNTRSYGA